MDEELESLGRYESAVGWQAADPYKKRREKFGKQQEIEDRQSEPILHSPHEYNFKPAGNVFSTLWRGGEVALLFGAPGVGKSIFAVHLAEAIARGTSHLLTDEYQNSRSPEDGLAPVLGTKLQKVLYIDLQRTETQFQQRFRNVAIERRHFDWSSFDSEENDNIRAARIHSSIYQAIEEGAEVIILDDITLGGINIGRLQGPLRTLRTLKMFAAEHGTSFLVIANARPRKRPHAAALSDVAHRHIAEQADSVFCLAASTWSGSPPAGGGVDVALDGRGGGSFRYIRHLRASSSPIIHDASNVLTYVLVDSGQLTVDSENQDSPPCLGGVANGRGGSSENFPASSLNPQSAIRIPQFLGTCEEQEHLRDYAAEALRNEREKERQLKRSWKQSNKEFLVNGMLDGSYRRYLKGE